jgi:hypothetical protein
MKKNFTETMMKTAGTAALALAAAIAAPSLGVHAEEIAPEANTAETVQNTGSNAEAPASAASASSESAQAEPSPAEALDTAKQNEEVSPSQARE